MATPREIKELTPAGYDEANITVRDELREEALMTARQIWFIQNLGNAVAAATVTLPMGVSVPPITFDMGAVRAMDFINRYSNAVALADGAAAAATAKTDLLNQVIAISTHGKQATQDLADQYAAVVKQYDKAEKAKADLSTAPTDPWTPAGINLLDQRTDIVIKEGEKYDEEIQKLNKLIINIGIPEIAGAVAHSIKEKLHRPDAGGGSSSPAIFSDWTNPEVSEIDQIEPVVNGYKNGDVVMFFGNVDLPDTRTHTDDGVDVAIIPNAMLRGNNPSELFAGEEYDAMGNMTHDSGHLQYDIAIRLRDKERANLGMEGNIPREQDLVRIETGTGEEYILAAQFGIIFRKLTSPDPMTGLMYEKLYSAQPWKIQDFQVGEPWVMNDPIKNKGIKKQISSSVKSIQMNIGQENSLSDPMMPNSPFTEVEKSVQYEIDRLASLEDIKKLRESLKEFSSSRTIYDEATIAGRIKDHIAKFPDDDSKSPAQITAMTDDERVLYEQRQTTLETDFRDNPDIWNAIITPDSFGSRDFKKFSHAAKKSLAHIKSIKKRLPPAALRGGALPTYEMVTMGQIRPQDWPLCEELIKAVKIHSATYSTVVPDLATDSTGNNVRYATSKTIFSGRNVILNNRFNLDNLSKQQTTILTDLNAWIIANTGAHTPDVLRSLPNQDITNILNSYLAPGTISGATSYNEATTIIRTL